MKNLKKYIIGFILGAIILPSGASAVTTLMAALNLKENLNKTAVFVSANYVASSTVFLVIASSSSPFTVTLPSASVIGYNKPFDIKNEGSAQVTVTSTSSQTIFFKAAATSGILSTGDSFHIQSDGSNWHVL